MLSNRYLATLALMVLGTVDIAAQTQDTERVRPSFAGRKMLEARSVASDDIALDGRLDDPAWARADFVSDFLQKNPVENGEPSESTAVAVVFTSDAVYVGARMYSDNPGAIVRAVNRRDQFDNAERIIVSFDTFADGRTAYSFSLTAGGTRLDWYHPNDVEFPSDRTYDPVWEGVAKVDELGWVAEMRIPLSQLRFNASPEYWGVNFNRFVPARNEDIFWVVVPRAETGWASRMGRMVGVDELNPPMRIEVLPYFASDATFTAPSVLDTDDPFADRTHGTVRGGADLKVGLGSNVTLDATINPDFGQVDADPAEVNLSAFETFFDERRPFFVEGSQLLQGNGPGYYYSRRIGGAPLLSPDGDFTDEPSNSTILTAGKLTGRLSSGMSIATVAALTDDENARVLDETDREISVVPVAPTTVFVASRVQQEVGSGSTLGGSFTSVTRSLAEGSQLVEEVPSGALAGGVDWNIRWDNGAYDLTGYVGASRVAGSANAITELQESSTHYFQRPDATHVTLDSSRTSLEGWTASVGLGKNAGNWLWYLGGEAISPGFDINDAGQLRQADQLNASGELFYRVTDPGTVFRNWRLGLMMSHERDFGGVTRPLRSTLSFESELVNYLNLSARFNVASNGYSNQMTRGGPTTVVGGYVSGNVALQTNFSNPVRGRVSVAAYNNPLSDWEGMELEGGVDLRTSSRWSVALGVSVDRGITGRQYVDDFAGGPSATFGRRYVLSRVRNRTYSMNIRGVYSFTPDLSLELYAEPFAASREFFGFGEVADPGQYALREYGDDGTDIQRLTSGDYLVTDGSNSLVIEDPDVNTLSFRSNLVLRWEWRPGSTLFVVWQQNNEIDDRSGRVGPGDAFESLTTPGRNFLSVKFSYWLSL